MRLTPVRLALFATAALCVSNLAAGATTITFSGLPSGNPPVTTYTEGGYTVSVVAGSFDGTSGNGVPPPSIFTPTGNGTIDVTDGGLFDFSSVALGNGSLSGTADFTITGILNGVDLFTATESVGTAEFNTYSFPADSPIAIDTLQIAATGDANIDNITVNAIVPVAATPEPSTFALLGTGMLASLVCFVSVSRKDKRPKHTPGFRWGRCLL